VATVKIIVAATIWLALIFGGFSILLDYQGKAGPSSTLSKDFPSGDPDLQLSSAPQGTLVMFVHPQCPCSSASISELALLMTHCKQLKAYVLFIRPKGFAPGWEQTSLWKRAAAIPGVQPIADIGGSKTAYFMASTSGETALYDRKGKLLFQGGITEARGHEGDNSGLSDIEALAQGQGSLLAKHDTAVFGCSLKDPQNRSNEDRH
jgi:hypothetical protein